MNNDQKSAKIGIALAFVGVLFFAIGFALGINSLLIPVLESELSLPSGVTYMLYGATFLPFILFGYPASMTIAKIGYKKTMALSFIFFAAAFALFIVSANAASFELFLLASFVSGTANTFLQASVNPYITILGPIESAARRMSIMGICNKLAWPIAPIFLSFVIGKSVDKTLVSDLSTPFYIILGIFILLGVLSLLAPLPEVKAAGEDEDAGDSAGDECAYSANKTSIWQFPHLLFGALTLFIYVGIETLALGSAVDYAKTIGLDNASRYAWIPSGGLILGYICGIIFIPKYLSQSKALVICSVLGIIGSIAIVTLPEAQSIWAIGAMGLGCSLMWPALWPLAMVDLGKFTKQGASLLVMAMAGGAVIPIILGLLKDSFTMQQAYWICLPCFAMILLYGLYGHKIRTK